MSRVSELLERKQTLLDRMQGHPESERIAVIEHELREIDRALNRMERGRVIHPLPRVARGSGLSFW